ncbi:MAG: ATP-dependent helicase [Candidatus Poseidoniales archaeon]|nr:MAG: ATP-dependent helicase [Candidatus Poseidoniales archaeon]
MADGHGLGVMAMSVRFADLGISAQMSHELKRAGFDEPFEVQRETIPDMMLGRDVCCRAPTGSGKTLAFGIPMLERVGRGEPSLPKALILTPTRELAEQIHGVLDPIAWGLNLKVMPIYGGVSYSKQIRRLDKGVDVVVACPGRLLDLIDRENVFLDEVEIVILDEADRMADMGFTEPVCQILEECSPKRQTIMFSATLDDEVAHIRDKYQNDPQIIEIGPEEISVTEMNHHFWLMPNSMKSRITAEAIRKSGRGFVFCRTRAGVDRVADELENEGLRVTSIHGGMPQRKRSQAVEEFGEGKTHAIVATDVAARGLDIKGVHCVVHFDPPENGKAFKHRSGRTARAGGSGNVISLVQNPQKGKWSKIQKEVGLNIKFSTPEFKDVIQHEEISHIPSSSRRGGRNSRDRKDRRGRPNDGGNRNRDRKHYGRRNGNDDSRGGSRGSRGNNRGGRPGGRSGGRDGGRDGGRPGGRSGGRSGGGGKPRFNRNNRPPKGPGRSRGRGGDNKRKSRNNHSN